MLIKIATTYLYAPPGRLQVVPRGFQHHRLLLNFEKEKDLALSDVSHCHNFVVAIKLSGFQ